MHHNIYNHPNIIDALNTALVDIINHTILSKIIRCRLRDKVWFNDDCGIAYQEKQSAYRLWSRNKSRLLWENYARLRSHAQSIYADAQAEYKSNLRETLTSASQPHK